MTETIILSFASFLFLLNIYALIQLQRNLKVFQIRVKWLLNDDLRYESYSYNDMFKPNKSNWFGLKLPNEKDY
jgi:hypothetical protein